jgi:Cd2+/Zn2+-exporting ATPase
MMRDTVNLKILDLDCPDCAAKLERSINSLDDVENCRLDFTSSRAEIITEDPGTDREKLIDIIGGLGYRAVPVDDDLSQADSSESGLSLKEKLLAVSVMFLLLHFAFRMLAFSQYLQVASSLMAIFTGGIFIFRSAFYSLKNLSADMNLLMSIAASGAIVLGEWSEAAAVIVLFSVANYLEARSVGRAQSAFESLTDKLPKKVERESSGKVEKVTLDQLRVGDIIHLKPGMTAPVDCEIIEGKAFIDQSSLTGEAQPVSMSEGDELLSGAINSDGFLRCRVDKKYENSTLARIIRMVREASARKARLANLVDRFARIYTPIVVAIAFLVAVLPPLFFGEEFATWFYRALVFLVISCPCALVISTPVAVLCALTRGARDGVLVKGGVFLEKLADLKAVLFDKTGTLTEGKFTVTDIVALENFNRDMVLSLAASIEKNSEHPIASAILNHARTERAEILPTSNFTAFPGEGARAEIGGEIYRLGSHRFFHDHEICDQKLHRKVIELEKQGRSLVLLSKGNRLIGALGLADRVKSDTVTAMDELRGAGNLRLVMLTGDNQDTARAVGRELGIDDIHSELLPADKNRIVSECSSMYGVSAMVGDGINDAPALATADVGIAMGTGGSDVAIEAADVAVIGDRLSLLPKLGRLARHSIAIIKFNIIFALATKFVFMILAGLGLANMWMAVVADMGTSLLVILNSMRLLKGEK